MTLILVLIGGLMLTAAAVAMSLRNIIHSALLLIGSWLGVSFFYLWAGAEFVAFAQVLVYVGAVSMVVLFAVLLTRRDRQDVVVAPETRTRAISALLVGGSVAGLLVSAVLGTPLATGPAETPTLTVKDLGTLLAGPQAAGLLIAGVILTVALLGAVVLAATDSGKEDAS